MPRTFIRQVTQIRPSDAYDDDKSSGVVLETGASTIEDDLNAIRSQLRRVLDPGGNWYDNPVSDLATILQLLQESQKSLIDANCLAADLQGMFVYVSQAEVAGVPQVTKTDITYTGKFPAIGIIESKSSDTDCKVQFSGIVTVPLPFLDPGKPHFVGLDSRPTSTPPSSPGEIVVRQSIGVATANNRLMLNMGTPFKHRG